MPIAFVQSGGTSSASATSLSVTLTITVGNMNYTGSGWGSTTVTASISDNNGNTWLAANPQTTGALDRAQSWHVPSANGGSTIVTVTYSAATPCSMAFHEVSGQATTGTLDSTAGASGNDTAPASGNVVHGTNGNKMGICCDRQSTVVTISAGNIYGAVATIRQSLGGRFASEDRVMNVTTDDQGAFSISAVTNWVCIFALFNEATAFAPDEDAWALPKPANVEPCISVW